jgi:hypothetical protein
LRVSIEWDKVRVDRDIRVEDPRGEFPDKSREALALNPIGFRRVEKLRAVSVGFAITRGPIS